MKTEKLGIDVNENDMWIGGHWKAPNVSGGYHGILETWWVRLGLVGNGLIVGEGGPGGSETRDQLKRERQEIVNIWSVDLVDADYNFDISYPIPWGKEHVDWIICCATLEHISCPGLAMQNLSNILIPGGRMYIHSVGPEFPEHKNPIDCCRFYRDTLVDWAERFELEIEDMLWTPKHWFALYKKK